MHRLPPAEGEEGRSWARRLRAKGLGGTFGSLLGVLLGCFGNNIDGRGLPGGLLIYQVSQ